MAVPVPVTPAAVIAHIQILELLWASSQLMTLLQPAILLFTGWGAGLRRACAFVVRNNRFGTLALFAAVYLLLAALVTAPLDFLRDPSQPVGPYVIAEAPPLIAKIIASTLFLWILYALIRRYPRWWWLNATVALIPVAYLILVALPVVLDPITAHYEPLKDKVLAAKIDELAARCGVHDIPVFVGGDDDTAVGLGPTKRIFLEADIAKVETPEQILGTVGHELKHYIVGDNYKALAIIAGVMLVGFLFVQILGRRMIRRWHALFGFDDLADPASLPLFVLILFGFWLLVLPVFNWEARSIEHEADRFGLELTHSNQASAELYAGWAKTIPAEYDWFFYLFKATHPSLGDRIRFANTYRPWETGATLVYGEICRAKE